MHFKILSTVLLLGSTSLVSAQRLALRDLEEALYDLSVRSPSYQEEASSLFARDAFSDDEDFLYSRSPYYDEDSVLFSRDLLDQLILFPRTPINRPGHPVFEGGKHEMQDINDSANEIMFHQEVEKAKNANKFINKIKAKLRPKPPPPPQQPSESGDSYFPPQKAGKSKAKRWVEEELEGFGYEY